MVICQEQPVFPAKIKKGKVRVSRTYKCYVVLRRLQQAKKVLGN